MQSTGGSKGGIYDRRERFKCDKSQKKAIKELFMNEEMMKQVHQNALRLGKPDAAYDIIDEMVKLIKE